jgi:membrane protein implicated in regulation of membrane protease activity
MQNQVRILPLLIAIFAAAACLGLAIYLAAVALPAFVRLSSVPGAAVTIGLVCSLVGTWVAISAGRRSWRRDRNSANERPNKSLERTRER